MIPSSFMFLDTLPLTSNGKIDRQALPVTDEVRRELQGMFVAPCTPTEKQIADIWAKVLKLDEIGIHDNFFDLGGHSLLAVRVTSEIEKALGKSLRLSAIFQAPTVAQLASLLTSDTPPPSWSSLAALQPSGSKPPFFWVHGESSDAFLPRYLGSDQPLYGLMHQSEDGRAARYTAVESIAAHYLSEIRTVQPNGPYFLGGYCFGGMVAFELAQQLKRHGEEVGLLVLLEPSDPWNGRPSPVAVSANFGLSSKAPLFLGEAFRHLHNLKLLKTEQQLSYACKRIAEKLAATANTIMSPVRQILKKAMWEIYLGTGCTLPSCLRNPYILHVYRRAIRSYVPQSYGGPMVVFQTEKHLVGSQSAWSRLSTGAVEVYAVPGNHTDVLTEANVRVWAGQLKTCLDRARSMVYRTPASANNRANAFSVPQRYRRNTGQDDHLRPSSHAIQLVPH
jgi:thioesterase domain-containing protein/acyl carrier protein